MTDVRDMPLVDMLDRLLDTGAVVSGDVTLSVADVDLVYVGLRALVSSVEAAQRKGIDVPRSRRRAGSAELLLPARRPPPPLPQRIDADADDVAKGLGQLVLVIVDLLRELMERQALHRVEGGTLEDHQVEALGRTFMALEDRMQELRRVFELTDGES